MAQTKDMTSGRPAGLIFRFALPLMMGNICQQLYIVIDSAIVGRVAGVEALAAIGAADWINWLVMGVVGGITQGFSILPAQRFGAGDLPGLRKAVGISFTLTAIVSALTTLIGLPLTRPLLKLLNTPENVLDGACTYLYIIIGCALITGGYNIFACTLRALGNSRTPLIAMLTAACINVGLDFVFVMGMKMGVKGAALGTVIAQTAAMLICFRAIRKVPQLKLSRSDLALQKGLTGRLFHLGMPVAFQNTIIALGGFVVQYVINGYGFLYVAAFTATNKLYTILEMAGASYGFAIATYVGQNLGAERFDRIRKGMRSGVVMALGTSAAFIVAVIFFGRFFLSMFISGEPAVIEQVLDIAFRYLLIMTSALPLLYLLHVYRCALQSMGNTFIPMLSGVMELICRIGAILLLPLIIGELGIYFPEPAAWLGAEPLLMIAYYRVVRQLELRSRQK